MYFCYPFLFSSFLPIANNSFTWQYQYAYYYMHRILHGIWANTLYSIIHSYLNIYFTVPPMLSIPNQLEGAYIGQDVSLECHTEAYPISINYWTYENGEMVPSGNFKKSLFNYTHVYTYIDARAYTFTSLRYRLHVWSDPFVFPISIFMRRRENRMTL